MRVVVIGDGGGKEDVRLGIWNIILMVGVGNIVILYFFVFDFDVLCLIGGKGMWNDKLLKYEGEGIVMGDFWVDSDIWVFFCWFYIIIYLFI